jgi:uncharacterized protein
MNFKIRGMTCGRPTLRLCSMTVLQLEGRAARQACHAMQHHSGGDVHTCATIQSCWDGDRLDLGSVGIKPHKDYLSEEGARLIAGTYKMSRGLPEN